LGELLGTGIRKVRRVLVEQDRSHSVRSCASIPFTTWRALCHLHL